jgi:protein-tyrosine phosphatase
MFSAKANTSSRLSINRPNRPKLPLIVLPIRATHKAPISSPSITPEFGVPSIIVPGLYLSGIDCMNEKILDKYNIKHVISVMNNAPKLSDKYTQYCVPIDDNFSAVIRPYFEKTHEIINEALSNGENILIHCHAGISRSATITISYIMKNKTMTSKDAYNFVRNQRNIIEPNFIFCYSLENYGKELQQ